MVTCAKAMQARDGCWLQTAGVVLVRQMPGSAKGVMFITIEDETGIANLVIWPNLFARQRRVVLSAKMMAVYGRIQREGEVVHLVAHRVTDLSDLLASIGHRDAIVPAPHGRGDELRHGKFQYDQAAGAGVPVRRAAGQLTHLSSSSAFWGTVEKCHSANDRLVW
jgi:error-prone DNA polymerase